MTRVIGPPVVREAVMKKQLVSAELPVLVQAVRDIVEGKRGPAAARLRGVARRCRGTEGDVDQVVKLAEALLEAMELHARGV